VATADLEKTWRAYGEVQKRIVLYILNMNPPISVDILMSLSETSAIAVLNVLEGLKKKKLLCERRGYQKGLYFLVGDVLQEFTERVVPEDEVKQSIKKLIQYYGEHESEVDKKNMILADLYGKLGDIKEGLNAIKSAADTFFQSGDVKKGMAFYDRVLEYFENREPTPENADIFLESLLIKLSMSKQLRPYAEQMVLLKKAEKIGKRFKRWELLARIKIELASELLVAGETAAAARNISDFQNIAKRIDNPSVLRMAALTMSELHFWQGRILEAIRSYEAAVGDVEDF
jgi:tetratricopeptide (TPR) repeat protein